MPLRFNLGLDLGSRRLSGATGAAPGQQTLTVPLVTDTDAFQVPELEQGFSPLGQFGSDLILWYDGSVLSGSDGDAINSITDLSGAGHNATAVNAPQLETSELNGKNVIRAVAANNDYMTISDFSSGVVNATMVYVLKVNSQAIDNGAIIECGNESEFSTHHCLSDGTVYETFASSARKTVGDPGDMSQWHIGCLQSAPADWKYFFNNDETPFFTTDTNTVQVGSNSLLFRGRQGHQSGHWLAEVMIVNAKLSLDLRQRVFGYLAEKWNLRSVLNSDQPYKSTSPEVKAAPSSFSYLTSAADVTDQTTVTFSSQSIGSADADRKIVVGVIGALSNIDPSSVTVGGVTATLVAAAKVANIGCSVYVAAVPTGTTADVVVTWPSTQGRTAIGLWRAIGISGAQNAVRSRSSAASASANGANLAVDTLNGGFIVGMSYFNEIASGTISARGVTEDAELDLTDNAVNRRASFGSLSTTSSQLTVGFDLNGGSLGDGIHMWMAVSFF